MELELGLKLLQMLPAIAQVIAALQAERSQVTRKETISPQIPVAQPDTALQLPQNQKIWNIIR